MSRVSTSPLPAIELPNQAIAPYIFERVDELTDKTMLKPGHHPEAQAVMDHIAEHIAHYKRIRTLEFMAEIPKSASGEIPARGPA